MTDPYSQSILTTAGIPPVLNEKWHKLVDQLQSYDSALVAFSGGVDSSFLVYAASLAQHTKMAAAMVVSPVEPPDLLTKASRFTEKYNIKYITLSHSPLESPDYRSNNKDRCYFCKSIILNQIWIYARENGYAVVLEGQNYDDLEDYRPGRKAMLETGTVSPLAQAGLTKTDIRWLSKAFGLPTWDQPASPCLSSRIPYGTAITEKALEQIARAEDFLHQKGFQVVRVRHHDRLARIEVEASQMANLMELHKEVVDAFKQLGYLYVTIDLQGFRSGSLNEGLKK
jgi:uncharacterized protein